MALSGSQTPSQGQQSSIQAAEFGSDVTGIQGCLGRGGEARLKKILKSPRQGRENVVRVVCLFSEDSSLWILNSTSGRAEVCGKEMAPFRQTSGHRQGEPGGKERHTFNCTEVAERQTEAMPKGTQEAIRLTCRQFCGSKTSSSSLSPNGIHLPGKMGSGAGQGQACRRSWGLRLAEAGEGQSKETRVSQPIWEMAPLCPKLKPLRT